MAYISLIHAPDRYHGWVSYQASSSQLSEKSEIFFIVKDEII